MQSIGRLFVIIVLVTLLFIHPLLYIAKQQLETVDDTVNTYASHFTDEARHQGEITKVMYEDFIQTLDKTGELFDISLEVIHPITGQELSWDGPGDKMPPSKMEHVSYDHSVELSQASLPIYSDTEPDTHEDVLILPFSSHTHTEECYSGHRHTNSVNNYFIHNHKHAACSEYIDTQWIFGKCKACGKDTMVAFAYYYWDGGRKLATSGTVTNCTYCNSASGTASSYSLYGYSYSCGYNRDADGNGLNDKTGYTSAYDYRMGTPPSTDWGIYSSGCYRYHQTRYLSDDFTYYSGGYTLNRTSARLAYMTMLENNFTGYCKIPLSYSIGLSTSDYTSDNGDTIDMPNITYAIYDAFIDTDGSIKFRYQGYWVTGSWGGNYYSNNPGFPSALNVSQFKTLTSNVTNINNMFKTATGKDWYYNKNGNIQKNIGWYCGNDQTQYLQTCTFDHSLGLKRWVQTCGQVQDDTVDCNQVVTSIVATNPNQSVISGSGIITTATAIYLDGHTGTVNCTSNFNTNQIGIQTVTLTYYGLVDNAKSSGHKTCTISVEVKPNKILTGITVSPATQTIPRYTSPSFSVVASYSNNTSASVLNFKVTNYNKTMLGTQQVTITYTEGGVTKTAKASVTVNLLSITCPICNTVYSLDEHDIDHGCPVCELSIEKIIATPDILDLYQGEELLITVTATYKSGKTAIVSGWTSDYDSRHVGEQEVKVSYAGLNTSIRVTVRPKETVCAICGNTYILNEDGSDSGCPFCNVEVTSIEVLEDQVKIEKHQSLPITVIATYRNGHSQEITNWSSDLTTDVAGTFEVTIFYHTVTDKLKVTVLEDDLMQCSICGLSYNYLDSPDGCPSCSKTIDRIEAHLRNGGTKVLYKSHINLEIVLIYKDNHKALAYSGWTISGYQPERLGIQTVIVHYDSLSTLLTIEVVDELPQVICPNGHIYYLNENGSDPGCPICGQDTSVLNAVFYFKTTYTTEIIDKIYETGTYKLEKGDFITVSVTRRASSIRSRLLEVYFVFNTNVGLKQKKYTFGGEIT